MAKTSIKWKDRKRFDHRDNINDLRILIEFSESKMEVCAFEWHTAGTYNYKGEYKTIHGLRVPVRSLFDAIKLYGKPDKAILDDGTSFWIMRSKTDSNGEIVSLEAGNSSPFTVIHRDQINNFFKR